MALYAFDGTWNEDEAEEGKDTNVVKFRDVYRGNVFYLEGVGTRLGFIGKILGGLTGAGGHIRIDEAMHRLEDNLKWGDKNIDIIGFSRGAALALHFANMIHNEVKGGAVVRFLGLWDVVASFGLPGNDLNVGWKLTLPPNVRSCFHAMALDERRRNFPLTRIQQGKGRNIADGSAREVWFRGVHSDVGGSASLGLSSVALYWMMRRAVEAGLAMDPDKMAEIRNLRNPAAGISKNLDLHLDPKRKILSHDLVHVSVSPRGNQGGTAHNDPPSSLPRTGETDEEE